MNETNNKTVTKNCLYCGKVIHGRSDKMFCDDRCRNNYYYKVNSESKAFVRAVNSKLGKNRSIIKMLNKGCRTVVTKSRLEELGFDFQHITGIYKTKKNDIYRLVYDQAYCLKDDGTVVLIVFYKDAQSIIS